MAETVYALCVLTSGLCAVLLLRGYLASRARLLFWSALCFTGFAANNLILFVDLVIFPHEDFGGARRLTALASVMLLIVGLVFDSDEGPR